MPKIGDKFGRWTVLSVNTSGLKYHSADCMCECGTSRTVIIVSLKSGRSTSCGWTNEEAVFGKVSTSVDVKGDGTPVWNKD